MVNLVAGFLFAGLVGAALVFLIFRGRMRSEAAERRLTTGFIVYCLVASFSPILLQRDLWPFSSWALMVGAAPAAIGDDPQGLLVVAVDADGGEQAIDYRAWRPFSVEEIHAWLRQQFPQLDADAQRQSAIYLLARVNAARALARGKGPAALNGWLGWFSAPFHQLHTVVWRKPADVPAQPFVGLRVYREFWNFEARRTNRSLTHRSLLYQFSVAP
ncbi:MAG: hypothetical protein ABJD11_03855 [Gemmatimonadota bacterium]